MFARALPLLLLFAGCSQSLGGFGPGEGDGNGLPVNRDTQADAGPTDAGVPPSAQDAGPAPPPPPLEDAGPALDAGADGVACVTWQDCPPWLADPNSGFACVDEQCTCDPAGSLSQGCGDSGGYWNAATCYCEFLDDDAPAECTVWQDCPPHYDSTQSGYECVTQQCTCDPTGQYQQNCAQQGGYWVPAECYCAFTDVAPPSTAPEPDCWWHLEEPVCDPDRWVDTSQYETQCHTGSDGEQVCESVWVESGYYEDGACPSPYWVQRCYG